MVRQSNMQALSSGLATLASRVDGVAAVNRDLSEVVQQRGRHERELEGDLRSTLERISGELERMSADHAATAEREQARAREIAQSQLSGQTLEERVDELERRLVAQRELVGRQAEDAGSVDATLADLQQRARDLEVGYRWVREVQERMETEFASLRAVRDREAELAELLEQHRATRARHEARLREVEELVAAFGRELQVAEEERALLMRQQAMEADRARQSRERLEALREALIDQIRRQVEASEESGRRRAEETDRELRVARELVTKLAEETEDVIQERPL